MLNRIRDFTETMASGQSPEQLAWERSQFRVVAEQGEALQFRLGGLPLRRG